MIQYWGQCMQTGCLFIIRNMSSPDKPTMVLEEFKYIDFLFKKVE